MVDMYYCPKCKIPLTRGSNKFGIFWVCPECNGRAISIYTLRTLLPEKIVDQLWQKARSNLFEKFRNCPICSKPIPEVPIDNENQSVCLDVCTKCNFVWFDYGEYESLPKNELPKEQEQTLPPKAQEALAKLKIEALRKELEDKDTYDGSPDKKSDIILALFGFPVEYNYNKLKQQPIITWLLGVMIVLVTLISFSNIEYAVETFGLIPAEFYRYYGFTFISSFFLHAGFLHLVGNLYFLLIFGDNVEDVLGKRQYLLLIILSVFIGDFFHIIGDPRVMIPCIGASGGISGILTYYFLRFPDARLGILWIWGWRWLRLPVRYYLILWVFGQIHGALWQTEGLRNVSALAHLGGALVGILFWIFEKRSLATSTNTS
jgi:membrane associated rhomboid family serine protease